MGGHVILFWFINSGDIDVDVVDFIAYINKSHEENLYIEQTKSITAQIQKTPTEDVER